MPTGTVRRPWCYFCGGNMVPDDSVVGTLTTDPDPDDLDPNFDLDLVRDYSCYEWEEAFKCPDCHAILRRGKPQILIDKKINKELTVMEKSKVSKRGGGTKTRKRKKKLSYKKSGVF